MFLLYNVCQHGKFWKSDVHSINTRDKHDLHVTCNFTSYQKGVYYAGTKLCNALPVNIKMLNFYMKYIWCWQYKLNDNEGVNDMFNSFLNNYIRIFNSSFPLQTVMTKKNLVKNKWITKGTKISCSTKRKLYLSCRQHPNEETKRHYQLYSKILAYVIREAKKTYYNKTILKSNNKSKTTWNIIKEISGHKHQKNWCARHKDRTQTRHRSKRNCMYL